MFNIGTGMNGYLGALLKNAGINIQNFNSLKEIEYFFTENIQSKSKENKNLNAFNIWVFGCPSSIKNDKDLIKLTQTLENLEILRKLSELGATIIYASSEGINHLDEKEEYQKTYNVIKYAITEYIKNNCDLYVNLVIPRVYGKHKEKGIFERIKRFNTPENAKEYFENKTIEYITEDQFINWVKQSVESNMLGTFTCESFSYNKKKISLHKLIDIIKFNKYNLLESGE